MKNPVCILLWREAAYSFEKKLPEELLLLRLTTGFIIATNDNFTHIATNVTYDRATRKLQPVDGFFIPNKNIIEFKKIGYYNE